MLQFVVNYYADRMAPTLVTALSVLADSVILGMNLTHTDLNDRRLVTAYCPHLFEMLLWSCLSCRSLADGTDPHFFMPPALPAGGGGAPRALAGAGEGWRGGLKVEEAETRGLWPREAGLSAPVPRGDASLMAGLDGSAPQLRAAQQAMHIVHMY